MQFQLLGALGFAALAEGSGLRPQRLDEDVDRLDERYDAAGEVQLVEGPGRMTSSARRPVLGGFNGKKKHETHGLRRIDRRRMRVAPGKVSALAGALAQLEQRDAELQVEEWAGGHHVRGLADVFHR